MKNGSGFRLLLSCLVNPLFVVLCDSSGNQLSISVASCVTERK